MKVYEALKELIKNKKVIQRKKHNGTWYYKIGKIEGTDDSILLKKWCEDRWKAGNITFEIFDLEADTFEVSKNQPRSDRWEQQEE